MKSTKLIILIVGGIIAVLGFYFSSNKAFAPKKSTTWGFQSIDTMKFSRDLSREKLKDPDFQKIIERQMEEIAASGATYVAIATPYDAEFYPILKRWVDSARKNKLKVWFRGNFSGWEGWFDYKKISKEEHLAKTQNFILDYSELFEDGDVFTGCPECENGGLGDPRNTGDIQGHRKFLIEEYYLTKSAFNKIGKKVKSNFNSMNFDVAKAVMDKTTTKSLDNLVVIDHYVKDPEELDSDIKEIAKLSGGNVILGEFGAPIPDIHGEMSELEQKEWLSEAMELLEKNPYLLGVNYWVGFGGSTELWDKNNKPRAAVKVLNSFFKLKS